MRIQHHPRKNNKFESRKEHETQMKHILHGEGLYVYRNKTQGDLTLPKPTASGQKVVRPNQTWEGDNYYMVLVPQEASIVRVIEAPKPEREKPMQEQKLILDQPDKVTTEGTVENVVVDQIKKQKLNEGDQVQKPEVLLNEDSMDGVQILRG